MLKKSKLLLGTKALFNKIIHLHNQSISAFFGKILNAITINGFGLGCGEILQTLIQVVLDGEGLASRRAASGQSK